jgi:hypothetical protein
LGQQHNQPIDTRLTTISRIPTHGSRTDRRIGVAQADLNEPAAEHPPGLAGRVQDARHGQVLAPQHGRPPRAGFGEVVFWLAGELVTCLFCFRMSFLGKTVCPAVLAEVTGRSAFRAGSGRVLLARAIRHLVSP